MDMELVDIEDALPGAFVYFEDESRPGAVRLTEHLQKIAGTDLALPTSVVTAMGHSLDQGDRLGDAWYADARSRGTVRQAREEFNTAVARGIENIDDPAPALVALFTRIHLEPEWLDWDLFDRGATVFRRYGKELYPYFGMATFAGYRTPSVTKPLILTGAYTGNSALNRFWETCKHWTDVSEPGGMRPGRPGFVTSLHVRLLHCMIRARIVNHREWDRAHLGVPISQFNMFNTLMAGSVISGQQLRSLGYRTSDDDIVAMLHMWRYIGFVMGVETPWYPETIEDGYRAMRLIAVAQRTEDNEDSRKLCHSFMDAYKPDPAARGWARAKAEFNYRFQLGHAYFYTPGSYVKSGFPDVGLWRHAPLVRVVPNYLRDTACRHSPWVAQQVDRRHRDWRQRELERTLGAGKGSYSPVETLSR
jgi:hypothetical protein